MALTYAVTGVPGFPSGSSPLRDSVGRLELRLGTLTPTGTNTAGGDAVTAAQLGLAVISHLSVGPAYNGTLVFQARAVRQADGTWKVAYFGTNAVPGAAVGDPEVTAGTTLTNYASEFVAYGW